MSDNVVGIHRSEGGGANYLGAGAFSKCATYYRVFVGSSAI